MVRDDVLLRVVGLIGSLSRHGQTAAVLFSFYSPFFFFARDISSQTPDGEIHPIVFHSCSFNSAELNYDSHDKELLAIFEAFKHW